MRHGTTMIGLLVSAVILLVLAVVSLNAINKAMTGAGNTLSGTVASHADRQYLNALFQSMAVHAQSHEGRYPVPSRLTRRRDTADDTTASLYSAMIAQRLAVPDQLISSNERSPYVWFDEDYNYNAYDPTADVHWDPTFTADLEYDANVSFAHIPLAGNRLRTAWSFTAGTGTALLGNRGPKDGVANPQSWTYGDDGEWAGHVVFGDGHIEFVTTFTPGSLFYEDHGQRLPDNLFRVDDGVDGVDAILAFTKAMSKDGPELQFD